MITYIVTENAKKSNGDAVIFSEKYKKISSACVKMRIAQHAESE